MSAKLKYRFIKWNSINCHAHSVGKIFILHPPPQENRDHDGPDPTNSPYDYQSPIFQYKSPRILNSNLQKIPHGQTKWGNTFFFIMKALFTLYILTIEFYFDVSSKTLIRHLDSVSILILGTGANRVKPQILANYINWQLKTCLKRAKIESSYHSH